MKYSSLRSISGSIISLLLVITLFTSTYAISLPTSCLTITKTIGVGSSDQKTNGQVTLLQQFLNSKGYLLVTPNGYYGPATKKAVQQFQKDNNIYPSGTVSSYTRALIKQITCTTSLSANDPEISVGNIAGNTVTFYVQSQSNTDSTSISFGDNAWSGIPDNEVQSDDGLFVKKTYRHTYSQPGTYTALLVLHNTCSPSKGTVCPAWADRILQKVSVTLPAQFSASSSTLSLPTPTLSLSKAILTPGEQFTASWTTLSGYTGVTTHLLQVDGTKLYENMPPNYTDKPHLANIKPGSHTLRVKTKISGDCNPSSMSGLLPGQCTPPVSESAWSNSVTMTVIASTTQNCPFPEGTNFTAPPAGCTISYIYDATAGCKKPTMACTNATTTTELSQSKVSTQPGEPVTITWSSINASSCTLESSAQGSAVWKTNSNTLYGSLSLLPSDVGGTITIPGIFTVRLTCYPTGGISPVVKTVSHFVNIVTPPSTTSVAAPRLEITKASFKQDDLMLLYLVSTTTSIVINDVTYTRSNVIKIDSTEYPLGLATLLYKSPLSLNLGVGAHSASAKIVLTPSSPTVQSVTSPWSNVVSFAVTGAATQTPSLSAPTLSLSKNTVTPGESFIASWTPSIGVVSPLYVLKVDAQEYPATTATYITGTPFARNLTLGSHVFQVKARAISSDTVTPDCPVNGCVSTDSSWSPPVSMTVVASTTQNCPLPEGVTFTPPAPGCTVSYVYDSSLGCKKATTVCTNATTTTPVAPVLTLSKTSVLPTETLRATWTYPAPLFGSFNLQVDGISLPTTVVGGGLQQGGSISLGSWQGTLGSLGLTSGTHSFKVRTESYPPCAYSVLISTPQCQPVNGNWSNVVNVVVVPESQVPVVAAPKLEVTRTSLGLQDSLLINIVSTTTVGVINGVSYTRTNIIKIDSTESNNGQVTYRYGTAQALGLTLGVHTISAKIVLTPSSPSAQTLESPWSNVATVTVENVVTATTTPPVVPLTVTIAQGATTTDVGARFGVLWTSTGATSCTMDYSLNNGASWTVHPGTSVTGNAIFTPTSVGTYLFRVNCSANGATSVVKTLTHIVSGSPIVDIVQSPSQTITSVGTPFTISWTSVGADSCVFDVSTNGGAYSIFSSAASGSAPFFPSAPGAYTGRITCVNGVGTTTRVIQHTVAAAQLLIQRSLSPTVLGASTVCVDLPMNLHRGAENTSVTKLQNFLISKDFLVGPATGFYGDQTVEAVKLYQGAKDMPQTGMVYDFTRRAIKNDSCGEGGI